MAAPLQVVGSVPAGQVLSLPTNNQSPLSVTVGTDPAAIANIANWFVNSVTGNDSNNGLTAGTALATVEALSQLLCPNGVECLVNQNTVIQLSGALGVLELAFRYPAGTVPFGIHVQVLGVVTQGPTLTLTAVTNTASGTATRGQLTCTGGGFTAHQRIRSLSGANAGALAFSTGQNANAQNHFVSPWFNYNTATVVNIANGTTCCVETISTTLQMARLTSTGNGYVTLQDLIVSEIRVSSLAPYPVSTEVYGCETGGTGNATWQTNNSTICFSCRMTQQAYFASGAELWYLSGCSIQANAIIYGRGSEMRLVDGNAIDGGQLTINNGYLRPQSGPVEIENGIASYCLRVTSGGFLDNSAGALFWGASTVYAIGVQVDTGAGAVLQAAANMNFPSTANYSLTGHTVAFAGIPINVARAACFIGIQPDPGAATNTL